MARINGPINGTGKLPLMPTTAKRLQSCKQSRIKIFETNHEARFDFAAE